MEEQPKSSPRRRWRKWLIITLAVLVMVSYGLAQLSYLIWDKRTSHPITQAANIAVGLRLEKYGYQSPSSNLPEFATPTCNTKRGKNQPYRFCIGVFRTSNYEGCAWWRFEQCLVLEAEEYQLSQADLLGPMLNALHDPCRYLPKPEEIEKNQAMAPNGKDNFLYNFHDMDCGGDAGGYPGKVVVQFINEQGETIARYVKRAHE